MRITVRPYEYITFSWDREWFKKRVEGLELRKPIIKEDRVYLPIHHRLPWSTPLRILAVDSNLYSLDANVG